MIKFEENIKLVYFVYEKYFKKYSFLKKDLYQEGFLALFKACKCFDKNRNNTFSSYAIKAIKNNMFYFLKNKELKNIKYSVSFSELENKGIEVENLELSEDFIDLINLKIYFSKILDIQKKVHKDIFIDYFYNDLTQKNIAIKYKMSQSQISKIIFNVKQKLCEYFHNGGYYG